MFLKKIFERFLGLQLRFGAIFNRNNY